MGQSIKKSYVLSPSKLIKKENKFILSKWCERHRLRLWTAIEGLKNLVSENCILNPSVRHAFAQ
jgi:hypothetical protein